MSPSSFAWRMTVTAGCNRWLIFFFSLCWWIHPATRESIKSPLTTADDIREKRLSSSSHSHPPNLYRPTLDSFLVSSYYIMSSAFSFFPFFFVAGAWPKTNVVASWNLWWFTFGSGETENPLAGNLIFLFFFYSAVMAVWPILHARLPGWRRRNKNATPYIRWSRYRAPVEKEKVYFASPAVISTRWGRVEKKSQCKPRPVLYVYIRIFCLWVFFSRWWAKLREKKKIVTGRPRALTWAKLS